jgi:hypothetical protein
MSTFDRLHVQVDGSCDSKESRGKRGRVSVFERKGDRIELRLPPDSRTVAYRLFAKGQEVRLHKPVMLYSFLQKFWVTVLKRRARESALVEIKENEVQIATHLIL